METVFFSWQADTPASNGRVFIERAVTEALKRVNEGVHIENAERDELILDRDTRGVAGQPPIVETILRKIDETAIFVPDMTFVGVRKDGRPTPNPNVLIEYGWALKGLGHARIVPVMNSAYGEPTIETMPFDMKHLRNPITYELPERASDRKREAEHIGLSKALEEAFRAVLEIKGLRNRTAVAPVPYTPAEPNMSTP